MATLHVAHEPLTCTVCQLRAARVTAVGSVKMRGRTVGSWCADGFDLKIYVSVGRVSFPLELMRCYAVCMSDGTHGLSCRLETVRCLPKP